MQEGYVLMTKKVILFLVEGPTDEDALAVIFTKLVNDHERNILMHI